ncbi:antifreeze protein [Pseudorhodobacter sp. E13]|uniref:antifreeze protein n=1 Tax=Pseudorhodobacter sp. E13 TaxID=2487931 RepID=UPI000F8E6DE6|nr:antifreeze protein [Pseudorhodobacter sp. E13]RUS63376.1 antifreeze protein [Pseudorhodobacter sp. E13]
MAKRSSSADPIKNVMQMSMMLMEAQAVISMRLMGMMGLWQVSPQENTRMVTEKVEAMVRSATDAGRVTMRGGSPDEITAAAIAPMRRATRANSKRLKKGGLKTP